MLNPDKSMSRMRMLGYRSILSALLLVCGVEPTLASELRFSPEIWKQRAVYGKATGFSTNLGFSRSDEFRKFLIDYNLIGMERAEVRELLGDEDSPGGYIVNVGPDDDCNIELKYVNGKVECWRMTGFRLRNLDWQYKNVTWMPLGFKFQPKYQSRAE